MKFSFLTKYSAWMGLSYLIAISSLQSQVFIGRDHPNRQTPNKPSNENRLRIINAATALPPYKNSAIAPGGQVTLAGQGGDLNKDGLSRVELWQRLSGNWYLSQYLVVNHRGAEVGRINTWTTDPNNRQRTRADKAWWTILHYTTDSIQILKTEPAPAQLVEISDYPRVLTTTNYPTSGNSNIDISNVAPAFGGVGAYSGNGFSTNISSIPNPRYWVLQEAGNPRQVGVATASSNFSINNASIGVASVTILPMVKVSTNLPSSYVGDRANLPPAYVRADDIYPQSTLALIVTLPSGQKTLLDVAGPFGDASSLTTFTHNWPLDLRSIMRDSGNYKFELWASTPVTENTGVVPGVSVESENPWWEKIPLPVEDVNVQFDNISAKNLRIITN